MFGRKSLLSKILKALLYGTVNFIVVLVMISLTKYNSQASIQSQLLPILIIVSVTGIVDNIVINKKFI